LSKVLCWTAAKNRGPEAPPVDLADHYRRFGRD
jgi:hypothetical protein